MDEEHNDHELEGRLYAMLHHVDETQSNVKDNNKNAAQIVSSTPQSTTRRYWRTNVESGKKTPKPPTPDNSTLSKNGSLPKEEKRGPAQPPIPVDMSIFQSPPQNLKRTIEIIDHEPDNQVFLESSDEDEVVEVALPPKPTITIESSDEDELHLVKCASPAKFQNKPTNGDRCVSASPVPSVVSSLSDDFIRGDCIALNISSHKPDDHSFDFSLHGPDLLDQTTPSKKKKKKKSKDPVSSTPIASAESEKSIADECFATPKTKAKNKNRKTFSVSEKSVPNADVYDSDSNQSLFEANKGKNSYTVTDKSLPSTDVYESDSSHSEIIKVPQTVPNNEADSSDSSATLEKTFDDISAIDKTVIQDTSLDVVDLTDNTNFVTMDNTGICENIVMGNVSGFTESSDYGDVDMLKKDISEYISTKVPPILNEDLDFDNLNGKDKVCKIRRYSLSTLRAEMEKFYNESWGGENFNHREIQKNMSRDKSLWAIDPKDRMPSMARRKHLCNYCNKAGHRDDTCRLKPEICYMCGNHGHIEPRCPRKICVNCGSPNHMYSTMCRNCCNWNTIRCSECGQYGHPSTHCPDLWRRYHNTIDENAPLEMVTQIKKHNQLHCSGCTRRGHLIHNCRSTVPFSSLPINSPYVFFYRPIYPPTNQNDKQSNAKNAFANKSLDLTPKNDRKRQSNSPTTHEAHVNKKRNLSGSNDGPRRNTKSPVSQPQRKTSQNFDDNNRNKKDLNKSANTEAAKSQTAEKGIAIHSNYNNRGQIIQDNEVSDTSKVVTSSRIYVTDEIIEQLKKTEGQQWLNEVSSKHDVSIEFVDLNSFLGIKGKVANQEAFQSELRDWSKSKRDSEKQINKQLTESTSTSNVDLSFIPKKRTLMLNILNNALKSLKTNIGDPQAIYKELTYLQNRHKNLLKQKIISPKEVANNRGHINSMLKKLNMVLVGQAGLANGSEHLNELYEFQEKLKNSTERTLSQDLRKEISEHYKHIFVALPRTDYGDLMEKFYHTSRIIEYNRNISQIGKSQKRFKKNIKSIPAQPTQQNMDVIPLNDCQNYGSKLRKKLVFYHQRLLKTRPNDTNLKKARVDLVRKLHSFIATTFQKEKIPLKMAKKMQKAQDQAQLFLASV